MFLKLRKKSRSSLILPKILWSMLIVFVYLIGRKLPISTVEMNQSLLNSLESEQLLNTLASVTGAQLSSVTLFSLGLSPWMTTMILWRFFTVFGMFKQMTSVQTYRYRLIASLLVATIQAFGLTVGARFLPISGLGNSSQTVSQIATILILVTGATILSWLGSINSQKGLGGMMIIIIVNMIISFQQNLFRYFTQNQFTGNELLLNILIFTIILFLLIALTVILYRGEYRIPIKRIGINNAYNEHSYMPIRVTPAGAMPFMYGMTLMMLPPYIISGLLYFLPNNTILINVATNIGLTKLPGVILYMVLLYVLAIGFAYYNYDAHDIAKNMRNDGDFIEGIRPGLATKNYIQSIVNKLAQFGAFTVILIGGGPIFVVVLQQSGSENISIAMLISNAFIIGSLMLGIVEQINTLQNWKKYRNLI